MQSSRTPSSSARLLEARDLVEGGPAGIKPADFSSYGEKGRERALTAKGNLKMNRPQSAARMVCTLSRRL